MTLLKAQTAQNPALLLEFIEIKTRDIQQDHTMQKKNLKTLSL